MLDTINERVPSFADVTMPPNDCELRPVYMGKASVMQDKLLEALKKAGAVYDGKSYQPLSEYAILSFSDCAMRVNVFVAGVYTQLPFVVPCKIEREFECAVHLATLRDLLAVKVYRTETTYDRYNRPVKKSKALPPERVDLIWNPTSFMLKVNLGASVSNLKCEDAATIENEPVHMDREFSKEETTELTWLKKAANKNDMGERWRGRKGQNVIPVPVVKAEKPRIQHFSIDWQAPEPAQHIGDYNDRESLSKAKMNRTRDHRHEMKKFHKHQAKMNHLYRCAA